MRQFLGDQQHNRFKIKSHPQVKVEGLIEGFFAGDRGALARIISLVENDSEESRRILDVIYPQAGKAYRVGVTGPPGAGKSTLVNGLTRLYRKQGEKVGIIAVDPTSPFTGGALLGDRIRMSDFSSDQGVFIRSMASRGSPGGLSKTAQEVADVLDAFGKEVVILETVGVGQSELDIVQAADTTIVVLVPESGDSIQAMKAGLMEIADILVLNKADREGADQALLELKSVLSLRQSQDNWNPPLLRTVATQGEGLDELQRAIAEHRKFLQENRIMERKRAQRISAKVREILDLKMKEEFWNPERKRVLEEGVKRVMRGEISPYRLAEEIRRAKF